MKIALISPVMEWRLELVHSPFVLVQQIFAR